MAKKKDENRGWKIAGAVAGTVAALSVCGFAGYGIYSLADYVKNQQQEEVQAPEDNRTETPEDDIQEQLNAQLSAQFGI